MTITLAPKGPISDEHSELLAHFIENYPFVKVDGSRTYGRSLIPNVTFSMASIHDAMVKLDEDERAMVLAYHHRLHPESSTKMSNILQVTGDKHGAAPSADVTSRGLHPSVLDPVEFHIPQSHAPGVSSASSAYKHVIPSPSSPSFPLHAVEPPAKKEKREPPLGISQQPFMSAEESRGGKQLPISFLPQWFELSKLEKYGQAAQLWADIMGAAWCHEVIIVMKFVLLSLPTASNKL